MNKYKSVNMVYSRSESGAEIDAFGSEKRSVLFSSEIEELKMADVTKYRTTIPKDNMDEIAGNTTHDSDVTQMSIRNRDKSGDWKNDSDSNWYMESQKNNENTANLSTESITEWKYKNLYSISARTGGLPKLPSNWNASRTAALANAILGNRSDDDIAQGEKSILIKIREYLANYQESYGVPRTEYTFPALIKVMGQATGRSLLALLYVILNITPMAQILLYILRFILDKTISIQNTNDFWQMWVKYAILGLQLLCIYVCLVFIFGCIVMPILYMAIGIIVKITLYN